jgi:hypothetical protein
MTDFGAISLGGSVAALSDHRLPGTPSTRVRPRIKSSTGPSSFRLAEGRCTGQLDGMYACGEPWTKANCRIDPLCAFMIWS